MGIENIKRWQWMIIGAVIGLAMSYMWTVNGSDAEGMTGGNIDEFERDVMFQDPRSGKPLITDIIIRPPEKSFDGPVNVVTYKRLASDRKGGSWWLDKHLVATIPFKPVDRRFVSGDPNFTIEKFLAEQAKQHDFVKYRYAWWLEPTKAMEAGTLSGVFVIGLLWPSFLNLLVAGGFAGNRVPKKAAEKASPWYGKALSSSSEKVKPAVSAEDQQRLRDLTDAYEQKTASISAGASNTPQSTAAEPVPKLEGGHLEKSAEQVKEQDDIEIKGEYYPVLIHHKKKSDEEQKDRVP